VPVVDGAFARPQLINARNSMMRLKATTPPTASFNKNFSFPLLLIKFWDLLLRRVT